ncbi:MAG: phosphocholine cytidylyltransferase family protein [Acidobacteriota bacterium]|nr:phosphocholine cytidylyltransferase family protein [Acidobacteriota bacterium]
MILAAGVGNRLRPFTDGQPKCLLKFGEKSLIVRHLEVLEAVGAERTLIVVGYRHEQVKAEVEKAGAGPRVDFVYNPSFQSGSAMSLLCSRPAFGGESVIFMDADILYCRELLVRLSTARAENALLADKAFSDTGEEVQVAADASGRALELGKKIRGPARIAGESVGIYKVSPNTGQTLLVELQKAVEHDPATEYESIVNTLLPKAPFGVVVTDGLPWIEIDFAEDVERGRIETWPAIQAAEGS